MSSFFDAAIEGDCARLRALIAAGEDVNARSEHYGRTPLHFAADNGRADAVALLLENGADTGLRTTGFGSAGWTPLHNAASSGHPHCIALLLAAGSDANVKCTSDSSTPLITLGRCGASSHETTACVSLLIQAGARADAANNQGVTPIWDAVRKGQRKLAKLLLRAGAVIPNSYVLVGFGFTYSEWTQSESVRRFVDQVKARGGWREHARAHKRVLVGLVTKCKPMPDDAAGLVVEFWCPPGGF